MFGKLYVVGTPIGNLDDLSTLYLNDNQLCPLYPECLTEDHIGSQDTSGCLGDLNEDQLINVQDENQADDKMNASASNKATG